MEYEKIGKKATAAEFIKNDYVNEYLTFQSFLDSEIAATNILPPDGFTNRYKKKNRDIQIVDSERSAVNLLDKLAADAKKIIQAIKSKELTDVNEIKTKLLPIYIQVCKICGKKEDYINYLTNELKESSNRASISKTDN